MSCLDDAVLAALLEGTLDPEEVARVDAHVDTCAECRALTADLILLRSAEGAEDTPADAGSVPVTTADVGRRYRLLDVLGQGGMGSVHRALDRLTGRLVALKRVLVETPSAQADAAALAREFRTLATLRHPNIISVLDHGFDAARRPFFTMELLDDGAAPIVPFAASAPREAQVDLLLQLLSALGYLHRRGVVHRDIKPSNVMVVGRVSPVVKLLDFGLSTAHGEAGWAQAAGTLPYMAPELFRGGAAGTASDLYAAGVVAYEVLAGRRPFPIGREPAEMIAKVLGAEPDLTPLPPALRAPIGRALSKSPSRRPKDAAAMLHEIATAAGLAAPRDPAPVRDSYLAAARFTGRAQELEALRGALADAQGGRGSGWLVGGESGVGKSRLLDELRIRALSEGVLVVRGQALPSGGTAYHVWRRVLELLALHVEPSAAEASVLGALLPNLGALLDREVAPPPDLGVEVTRFRLFRVLREVVERSRDPVLVLLEDLQWADPESLSLLCQVVEDAGTLPLLVVASYRDDERPGLSAVLPGIREIHVGRFDRAGVAALCASMLGAAGDDAALVDAVDRATEGNTYFVIEAMRALADESGGLSGIGGRVLPAQTLAGGMEQVFARRLGRVPIEARSLLDLAAVAGRHLEPELLSPRVPRFDALARALSDAGVLEVHDQRLRFTHDKLRERVLGALDAGELRALHARVAEAIEAAYPGSDARAAELAHHYHASGQVAEAARCYALAGESALSRGAPAEAARMLDQARMLQDHVGAPPLAALRVWRGLVQARYALGKLDETHDALRRVCALAGTPLPSEPAGILRAIGRHAAEHLARRAGLAERLRLGPRGDDAIARAEQVLLGLAAGEIYVWLVRPELVVLSTIWGLNLEEALDARGRTNFRAAMGFVLSRTPLRGLAVRYLSEAATTAAAGTPGAIDMLRIQALIHLNAGRWTEAEAAASRAVACARAQRDDHALMQCLLHVQLALAELDEYAGVLATCREMERLAAHTQNPRYTALALLGQGQARFRLGELDEAAALIERARTIAPRALGPILEASMTGVAAACALHAGHEARAEALSREATSAVRRARTTVPELQYALACILEVYLSVDRDGRHDAEVRSLLADLHGIARRCHFAEPNAWLLHARHEHRLGHPLPAVRALRRSARAAERLGSRYQHAHARLWLGLLAQSHDARPHIPEGPAVHLEAARTIFEQLGCTIEAARARAAQLP